MIEVSFAHGVTARFAVGAELSTDLSTRRCECCGIYFTGPSPIMRGPQGETAIVCQRCKEAQSSERETVDVKRETPASDEVVGA